MITVKFRATLRLTEGDLAQLGFTAEQLADELEHNPGALADLDLADSLTNLIVVDIQDA